MTGRDDPKGVCPQCDRTREPDAIWRVGCGFDLQRGNRHRIRSSTRWPANSGAIAVDLPWRKILVGLVLAGAVAFVWLQYVSPRGTRFAIRSAFDRAMCGHLREGLAELRDLAEEVPEEFRPQVDRSIRQVEIEAGERTRFPRTGLH